MSVAKVLFAVVVVLALGLGTGFDLLLRVGYTLLGLVVLSLIWGWSSVRSLTVTRDTRNRRAQVGQTIEERFTISNNSVAPKLWVEVKDYSTLPNHKVGYVVSLGSRASKSWRVHTVCLRRGKFTLGPVSLQSGDTFGVFRFQRRLKETNTVLVYPETVPLPELNVRVGILPGGSTMRHRVQYITPNVSGVRDYAPGDSFNRIHWRSTARLQQLMVKEFELDPFSDIWLLLDMEARHHRGRGDESTEEYAVKATASLAQRFLDQNRSVGLAMHGPHRQVINPDRGTRQIWKLLEELAITKSSGRVPLVEMMTAEATRFGRNTTLVVITPSIEEDWVSALREVMQSGIKAVAVVVDAASFGGQGDATWVIGRLTTENVPTFVLRNGDTLDKVFVGDGAVLPMAPVVQG